MTSAKIGTVPMVIVLDKRYKVKVGAKIRFRLADGYSINGNIWNFAIVNRVESNGYLQADLV